MPLKWCWYLTLYHHVAALIELEQRSGPVSVLPLYDNVILSGELPNGSKESRALRRTLPKEMESELWIQAMKIPASQYYGLPYKAQLCMQASSQPSAARALWPYIGTTKEITDAVVRIYGSIAMGTLRRSWADAYAREWVPRTSLIELEPPKKAKGKGKAKAKDVDENEGSLELVCF